VALAAGIVAVIAWSYVIKADPQTHFLPIIGISSDDSLEARLEAASAGFDHFQAKPVELPELVARARVLVETGAVLRATAAKTESLMLWHDWVRYIVHDLRNPVGVAIGNLAYVMEEAPIASDESRRALEDARCELGRVTSMLQDILDTDRLQRGVLALERARVDLERLGRELLAPTRGLVGGRRLDVVLDAAGPCIVDGDPALLRRVLVNLMGNAVRYARSRVRLAFEGAPGAVRVSVENDGPGIGEELCARIFEPWIVLDPTGGVTHGTGLGLAFCRLVVAAHGGEIAVTSSAGPSAVTPDRTKKSSSAMRRSPPGPKLTTVAP